MLIEEYNTRIQNKLPSKLKDPRSFVVFCTIGKCHFDEVLCDLSANINLMPLSISKKLDLGEAKEATVTL